MSGNSSGASCFSNAAKACASTSSEPLPTNTCSGRTLWYVAKPERSRWRSQRVRLSFVELVRSHCPDPLVVAVRVSAIGLRRIAIDQRPQIHRVGGAAHLVLDREKVRSAGGIDDIAKAVLMLVVFLRDQAALRQQPVR